VAYTDGSADHLADAAGWAAVLLRNGRLHLEVQGWAVGRDSAWAELKAVCEVLASVPDGVRVVVHTDHFGFVEVFRGRGRLHRTDLRELWEGFRAEAKRRRLRLELRYRRRQKTVWSRWVHRLANGARLRALQVLGSDAKAA